MMLVALLVTLVWLSETQAVDYCENVIYECKKGTIPWTRQHCNENQHGCVKDITKWAQEHYRKLLLMSTARRCIYRFKCYEDRTATCTPRRRSSPGLIRLIVNSSQEAEVMPTAHHRVHIPSSALRRSSGAVSKQEVLLVASVIDSTLFEVSPPLKRGRGITRKPMQSSVAGRWVLAVKIGNSPVRNLQEPIKLTFKHIQQEEDGTCVFWQESELEDGTGHWSTDGCDTYNTGTEFICSCNHMSFFAVLVNPFLSVDESNTVNLGYITYIGSALTVFFTVMSLIVYIYLQWHSPEKTIIVHMQLTGALLCLHLSFLLSSHWVWLLNEIVEGWVCQVLGLFLHLSLLATFTWMALEGFHLSLLLVRIFNISVRGYMLKLSLVGWGLPTLTAVVCGISGVYGKYSLEVNDDNNQNSTAQMCWMSSHFPQRLYVSYITTVAFPCLVILYNSCMLGMVAFRLWGLRKGSGGIESTSGWKQTNREKETRLLKDCTTVLGLSCVLGLPWGLASNTYISLHRIYVFTILNSLQGLFMFLWSMALMSKSQSDNISSVRDLSTSQKMMTTSF